MKSAIEISKGIDSEWLCKLWSYSTSQEMSDFLHGFHQLEKSGDIDMRLEVVFLRVLCDTKRLEELK